MYKIEFTQKAEKQFFKLSREVQIQISNVLDRIVVRPEQFIERLAGLPYYKLRVGSYRLIIDLKKERLIVLILKVGHRKNIYNDS